MYKYTVFFFEDGEQTDVVEILRPCMSRHDLRMIIRLLVYNADLGTRVGAAEIYRTPAEDSETIPEFIHTVTCNLGAVKARVAVDGHPVRWVTMR